MILLRILGVIFAVLAVCGVQAMVEADGGYKWEAFGGFMFFAVIFVFGLAMALFPDL